MIVGKGREEFQVVPDIAVLHRTATAEYERHETQDREKVACVDYDLH